jgi:WD40 repeat protein
VSVYGVAFSPNGTIVVTGGTDGRIKIWTNTNGTLTAQGTVLSGTGLGAVAFSPDGSSLAVGRIGGVDIVNVSSWTVTRTLATATGDEAYAVGFSPDGTTVFTTTAPSSGTGVTGTLYAHAVGSIPALASLALISPFGMAIAPVNVSGVVPVSVTDGNGDASIYSWSATAKSFGTPLSLTVTSDGSTAEAAAFSPQATVFAAGGDDGILSLWNYPTSSNAAPDGQINITDQTFAFTDYVGAVAFSPIYGYLVVGGGFDGSLTAYTLTDGSQVGVEYDTSYDMISLAYSPTSNVIVGGELDCGCVVVCPQ